MSGEVVYTALNKAEADIVAARLTASGFEATVRDAGLGGLEALDFSQGVTVVVPADQADDARALLEEQAE